MKSTKKYLFYTLIILILLLPVIGLAADDEEVKIGDKNFKNALRDLCGVKQGEELYLSDVERLTGDIDLSNKDIESANGIKYLVNATSINLSYNNVSEIRGDFSELVNLKTLDLSNNDIFNKNEIYIEDIPNLESLDISGNKMTYFIEKFAKLSHLHYLDISANRMTDIPIALLDFNLFRFNCDYNFFDLSDGSKDREILDMLHSKGTEIHACRQLVKLPEISYSTESGKLIAKWKKLQDVPFYDGSKGEIIGYTVLLDGAFLKSVSSDSEYFVIDNASSGEAHTLSVSPDYKVEGFDTFKVRSYTKLENVVVGKSGSKLEDNAAPTKHENYYSETVLDEQLQPTDDASTEAADTESEEPVLTYDETKAEEEETQEQTSDQPAEIAQETFSDQQESKSSNLILLVSLLAVILVLICVISILLIKLWRNKNYVGKDEIEFDEFDEFED